MICEKNSDLIDDLVEGELDEPIAALLVSHVFACPKCRERYETLMREKEIYARYLFDAEPPKDMWTNFRAKLESEKEKTARFAAMPGRANAEKKNIFDFLRFSPTLAGAALLVVCGIGFGWLNFTPNPAGSDHYTAKTESGESKPAANFGANDQSATQNWQAKNKSGANEVAFQNSRSKRKSYAVKAKIVFAAVKKSPSAGIAKVRQSITAANAEKTLSDKNKSSETERAQRTERLNLENDIAGQIEKVELLLRSFRNARTVERDAAFDVAYEKGQARKLLEKNVGLRRAAETCGNTYAEELLSRVEPYLLDIANLENNPAPDKVLDIKERVKNQSIIASLQIY